METTTRQALGRSNRRRGHDAERAQARWLRRWWPEAKRKPDNGWQAPDGSSFTDCGDIANTPGVVWQVKAVARMSDGDLEQTMIDAEEQAVAASADYAIVVQRRQGKSDPARWWAWLRIGDLVSLAADDHYLSGGLPTFRPLVRLEQAALLPLLVRSGYGRDVRR